MKNEYNVTIEYDSISSNTFYLNFKKTNFYLSLQITGVPINDFINILKSGNNFDSEQFKAKRLSKRDLQILIEHNNYLNNCHLCSGKDIPNSNCIHNIDELQSEEYLEITTPNGSLIFCLRHCKQISNYLESLLKYGHCIITGTSFIF